MRCDAYLQLKKIYGIGARACCSLCLSAEGFRGQLRLLEVQRECIEMAALRFVERNCQQSQSGNLWYGIHEQRFDETTLRFFPSAYERRLNASDNWNLGSS